MTKSHIAIIGGGPAGLMAAEHLAQQGARVTVYDRMPTPGRKFLMAGRGGLNLTHSEPLDTLLSRYGVANPLLAPAIRAFPPSDLIAWCEGLGEPTFIGSSGRVFPKSFKASPLLRAWLKRLESLGVTLALNHIWTGWNADGVLTFTSPSGPVTQKPDATVLALGGASWPRLGSDGKWVTLLPPEIAVSPLRPSNCGLTIPWSDIFRTKFAGQPLKSIQMTYGSHSVPGELMITASGFEGTPAYALSGKIRDDLQAGHSVIITLDLRSGLSEDDLRQKLSVPRKRQSLSTFLQKAAGLSPVAIGLVQELVHSTKVSETPQALAQLIKALPLTITGTSSLDRAISSAGGVTFPAITDSYMLKDLPGVFVAGEMLDWEAPTGGYLLQASFSSAVAAAKGVLGWLNSRT